MLRRLSSVFFVLALLAPVASVSAQEGDGEPPVVAPDVFDALDVTADEVAMIEPNPAWNGLGLFSDDALRLIGAATEDRNVINYAFGDDPNGTPVFDVPGADPAGSGAMFFVMPDDWETPVAGWGTDMAFAQTASSQIEPGEAFVLIWSEMEGDYDFTSTRQVNEGFPMALPGLPVWNSAFAGDTWEGANVIPNAIYDNGVLTLDVKGFTPPQSFPLLDVAAFYYRSGNVMAMAVSTDDLVAHATGIATASVGGEGTQSNLLYTGDSTDVNAQVNALDEIMYEVFFFGWSHITENGQFTPGFIAYLLDEYGAVETALAISTAVQLLGPPPVEPEPEPAPVDEGTDEPAEPTEPSTVDITDDPPPTPPPTDTGGGGFPLWPFPVLVLVLIALAVRGATRTRGGGGGGTTTGGGDEDDGEDPRDAPPPTIYGEEIDDVPCDWGVIFKGAAGEQRIKTANGTSIGDYVVQITTNEVDAASETEDWSTEEQQERSNGFFATLVSVAGLAEWYFRFIRRRKAVAEVDGLRKMVGTHLEDEMKHVTLDSGEEGGFETNFWRADGIPVRTDSHDAVRMKKTIHTIEFNRVEVSFRSTEPSCKLEAAHSFNTEARSRADIDVESHCQLCAFGAGEMTKDDVKRLYGDGLTTAAVNAFWEAAEWPDRRKCESDFKAHARAGGGAVFENSAEYVIKDNRTSVDVMGPAGTITPEVGGPEVTVSQGSLQVAKFGLKVTPSTNHNAKGAFHPYGLADHTAQGLLTSIQFRTDIESDTELTPNQTTTEIFTETKLTGRARVHHQAVIKGTTNEALMGCQCNPPSIEVRVGKQTRLAYKADSSERLLPGTTGDNDAEIHFDGQVRGIVRRGNGWQLA